MDKIATCIIVASMMLAACAKNQPGHRVDPGFAAAWGCDHVDVHERAEYYRADLPTGHSFVPRVGWDACELMARVGRPRDIDLQQYGAVTETHWWYPKGDYDVRLVSLRQGAGQWTVRYVDW